MGRKIIFHKSIESEGLSWTEYFILQVEKST